MRQAVVVAGIAALPPTLAAVLAFVSARSAERNIKSDDPDSVRASITSLTATVARIETTTQATATIAARTEEHVTGLRERVARLEGGAAVPGGIK